MRSNALRHGVGALTAAILAFTGFGAAADPIALRAPHLKPDLASAEGGLWDQFDRAESYVRASAELEHDPVLTAYVRGVVCRLAPEYCGDLRVYVLDRPVFNAAAAANGYVEVNTGLLLRARDEDELAFVLGHEISHFARNHSLKRWRAQKTSADLRLLITAGVTMGAGAAMYSAAASGAPNAGQTITSISHAAQSVNDLVYLASVSSYFGFNREEESEADRLGLQRAIRAGYQPPAAARMWRAVLDETQASDFKRVRESDARASIFSTHPLTADRIAALNAQAAGPTAPPDPDAAKRYRATIRPHLADWLKDDLRRRDYGQTLWLLDRLAAEGEDAGVLSFYRGEVYRRRRDPGDADRALASYRAAVVQADAPAAAWRELGDACVKAGDRGGARQAFTAYLDRDPKAQDRWLVEDSLKALQDGGRS